MDVDIGQSSRAPWDTVLRSRPEYSHHSHEHQQRTAKRSPNRVKAKPANPAVISSIISSLDNFLPPPSLPTSFDTYSDNASRSSRPYSSEGTILSAASGQRSFTSPGYGPEYGNTPALEDDDSVSDAALAPSIPTTRAASGLSHYAPSRSPGPSLSTRESYFVMPATRRSSFSSNSIQSGAKNKLSAESWVKKHPLNGEKTHEQEREVPRRKEHQKSLRRMSSQEMLRPQIPSEYNDGLEPVPVSLAEQIIARTPPPLSSSRGRLYLRDSTIGVESSYAATPPSISLRRSRDIVSETAGRHSPEEKLTPVRISTLKTPSPISDSIPTRTSSLRQASSSPSSSRQREKKSKRPIMRPSKSDLNPDERSKSIPESSWADLGEDDETVKRIRELREQRKSRLQELSAYVAPSTLPAPDEVEKSIGDDAPVGDVEDRSPAGRFKSSSHRGASELSKAHKLLGIDGSELPFTGADGAFLDGPQDPIAFAKTSRQSNVSLDVKRPFSALHRPSTARSDNLATPSLSLDYSYSQAVNVLQHIDRDMQPANGPRPIRDAPKRHSFFLRGIDAPTTSVPPLSPTRSGSRKLKKVPRDRSTSSHAELASDFEAKRNRQRSISDARQNRMIEEDTEFTRRNSIEDAASNFLQAPRLSRTVRSPVTGRLIAFSEVGDPEGAAVFVCVGMGLTRFVTAFYDELASTLRLRLITVDRPGVGGSEPHPASDKSGPLGWPEDILAICEFLEITDFSLLAHSAGAVYALATALILPNMVKGKVHLLAPWIPPSQLEAISHTDKSAPPANALPRGQRFLRVLPTPLLKAANSSFMTASYASLKPTNKRKCGPTLNGKGPEMSASPNRGRQRAASIEVRPDYSRRESIMLMDRYMPATNPMETFPIPIAEDEGQSEAALRRGSLILSATATPTDPSFTYAATALNAAEHAERKRQIAYTSRLTEMTWDLATRDSNPATDLLVCLERHRDVGFRYTDVGRAVVITHGSEDKRVPLANVKWLAEQMNRSVHGLPVRNGIPESREGWADATVTGGCELRALNGEGHGLMANPVVMGDILTEIAGYWHERPRFAS